MRYGFGKTRLDGCVLRVFRKVGPLVGIGFVVVKLLRSIGVADVAPALAAKAVIVSVVCGERRVLPCSFRIF